MSLTIHISKLLLERTREGVPSFNVMVASNFDLLFTFVTARWEGVTHDTCIFLDAIHRESVNFPKPPPGI